MCFWVCFASLLLEVLRDIRLRLFTLEIGLWIFYLLCLFSGFTIRTALRSTKGLDDVPFLWIYGTFLIMVGCKYLRVFFNLYFPVISEYGFKLFSNVWISLEFIVPLLLFWVCWPFLLARWIRLYHWCPPPPKTALSFMSSLCCCFLSLFHYPFLLLVLDWSWFFYGF